MDSVGQFAAYGPTVILLLILLGFVLKALPTWKEIKLREFELREKEVVSRSEIASTVAHLGELVQETTRTTDELRIFMRSAAREREEMSKNIDLMGVRLDQIEKKVDSIDQRTRGQDAKIA